MTGPWIFEIPYLGMLFLISIVVLLILSISIIIERTRHLDRVTALFQAAKAIAVAAPLLYIYISAIVWETELSFWDSLEGMIISLLTIGIVECIYTGVMRVYNRLRGVMR